MILQRDLQGSKVLWPQMERTCLPSGCALPSLFLTACKTFAKAGSTFFFPFLFCWIWFLIYFDLSLHINLEVSLHNLLERCMLSLLVSAFLQPHGAALQSCGEVWWWAGWGLRGHGEIASFPAQDPRLAPACPCHGTIWCWVIHLHPPDEQWVPLGAAASSKEGMRNLALHVPLELLWWKIISVHGMNC